jgi:hypothetical protein
MSVHLHQWYPDPPWTERLVCRGCDMRTSMAREASGQPPVAPSEWAALLRATAAKLEEAE